MNGSAGGPAGHTRPTVRFGISTHLFHDSRLTRDHLCMVAEAGFEHVELFALKSHFDYGSPAAAAELAGWLRETRLALHSVHAPIADTLVSGVWGRPWSIAAGDARRRAEAVREVVSALELASVIPFRHLVLHVGVPEDRAAPDDNQRDAARRALEEIEERAAALAVALAIEVIPNALSTPEALVRLIDGDLDNGRAGACLDFGHAHLMGGTVDAVETLSGFVQTTHVHDNDGRADDHLMPFDGSIDWEATLLSLQKVGYDEALIFELRASATPRPTLERARQARQRFEALLLT
jgi:sugar phosphate isomerase/epimerase